MERNFFLCALLFLGALPCTAQNINYGLSLAGNATNIQGNGISNSYYLGFAGGGFARISLNNKWDLQPEILYNYENSKSDASFINYYNVDGNPNASNQVKLSYISIPVLFGYKVNKLLTINAGPQYSFLVYDNEDLILANKADAFKRNDFGIVAGLQIDLANVRFFANYVFGLANINNIDNRYKWYNRQILLGMNFNLF
jgi:hypothetical protein